MAGGELTHGWDGLVGQLAPLSLTGHTRPEHAKPDELFGSERADVGDGSEEIFGVGDGVDGDGPGVVVAHQLAA
jgi:hypothetical protein